MIELMDRAEANVGAMLDAFYRRLTDRDFAAAEPKIAMWLVDSVNILGHDNRGEKPHGSLVDGRIRSWRGTRPPKIEVDEVEKCGFLRK